MGRGVLAGLVALLPAIAAAQPRMGEGRQGETAVEAPTMPSPAAEPAIALAGAVDASTYVLGPGDTLRIELWGARGQSLDVEVNAEGRFLVSRIGIFGASGRTLASLRDEVVRRLNAVYPRLNISLTLVRPRVFTVYVAGAVTRPGSYRATALTRVSELILRTGPLPNASTRRVEIRRKTLGAPIIADMVRFSVLGDPSADPTVLDGDTVYLPLREFEVEASGAVRRPGRYELVGARTGQELLELAGGPSSDAAVGLPLRITTRVQDDRIEARSVPNLEEAAATQLRPGDVLRIPTLADLHRTVTIEGAIRLGSALPDSEPVAAAGVHVPDAVFPARPPSSAQVPFVDGDTVRDAIAKVGGLQPWADGQVSYLIRVGSDGARQRLPVDVLSAGTQGGADTPLQSGDTIVVPNRRDAVIVGGAVYHPGIYTYSRELKPLDYVTLAGGATRNGRPDSARVLRRTGQSVQMGEVREIEPGDVISVPEATVSTSEWISFAIIIANLAVGTTALVLTATHH